MSKRVLIVDDDPMIRDVLSTMLGAEGYETVTAENGKQAATILDSEERPLNYCLIVLDVMMPEMNGLDLLTRLKLHTHTQNIPVLMLTGEDKNDDMMVGYSCGADYYITKPFTRQQLQFGLKTVLGG